MAYCLSSRMECEVAQIHTLYHNLEAASFEGFIQRLIVSQQQNENFSNVELYLTHISHTMHLCEKRFFKLFSFCS